MELIDGARVHAALDYAELIEALRRAFAAAPEAPLRHQHTLELEGQPDASLLLMPAWRKSGHVAVKIVTVFPGNAEKGKPAVNGQVLLIDGATGVPLALMDGEALTARRTACTSALAASYLARQDAETLLMVGVGALAPHLVAAHAALRPIRRVLLWNRTPANADKLAAALGGGNWTVEVAGSLEAAAREADIISCATLSLEPLIRGAWLKPGCHLDLVGAFRPHMRECDDEAVARARVYVDTRAGALSEGGDLVQALAAGVFEEADVAGELAELCRGEVAGRGGPGEITLFKSVGTAIEDLAAAELVVERSL